MLQQKMLSLISIKKHALDLLKTLQEGREPETSLVEAVKEDKENNQTLLDTHQSMITDDEVNEILKAYYQIDLLQAKSYDDFLNLMYQSKSNLKDVPISFRDEKLCLEAMKTGSSLSDVPEELINENLCREYVGYYPWNFYEIPEKYLTRELCLSWVEILHLGAIPIEFRDREMCLKAMHEDHGLMGAYCFDGDNLMDHIPEELKEDKFIIEQAKKVGLI